MTCRYIYMYVIITSSAFLQIFVRVWESLGTRLITCISEGSWKDASKTKKFLVFYIKLWCTALNYIPIFWDHILCEYTTQVWDPRSCSHWGIVCILWKLANYGNSNMKGVVDDLLRILLCMLRSVTHIQALLYRWGSPLNLCMLITLFVATGHRPSYQYCT